MYKYTCIYTVYIYIYVCVYVCMYTHICVYIHICMNQSEQLCPVLHTTAPEIFNTSFSADQKSLPCIWVTLCWVLIFIIHQM